MTERFFSTFQIASLLHAAPAAVVEWMDKGRLNFSRTPGGAVHIAESDLVRFLEDQGFHFGEELNHCLTPEQRDEVYRQALDGKAGANNPNAPIETVTEVAVSRQDQTDEPDQPSEPVDDEPERKNDRIETETPGIEANELSLPEAPQAPPIDAAPRGDPRAGQICDAILADAVKQGARAVHLTPQGDGCKLQLRINGSLHDKPHFNDRLPDGLRREIVARFLNLANLDIVPEDLAVPHSVEFVRPIEGAPLTLRLSVLPTVNGPRLVIHMPHRPAAGLGLENAARTRLEKLLQGDGLIVVASKRRTGRDLTLRALLGTTHTDGCSAIAIERNSQPHLDDVVRIKIDRAAGLTCATAMGAMEYQDADVILLTELRDPGTALAAFDAAHDGALVIAGVNANSALGAIRELLAMGLEPWPLAATLKAIVEQASVRTLREHCWQSPGGCGRCGHTGWSGSAVLSGVVFIEGQLVELIRTGAAVKQLELAIVQESSTSLAHTAQAAVNTGLTTPAEIARILGHN